MEFLISLTLWVAFIIGLWKTFEKAGYAGWKSLIPIYGDYVRAKICGLKDKFIIYFILQIGYGFAFFILMMIASVTDSFLIGMILVVILTIAVLVYFLYYHIILAQYTAKVFNQEPMFAALIFFVPVVAYCIIGFTNVQYLGYEDNNTEVREEETVKENQEKD